jgi:hypothetical protein
VIPTPHYGQNVSFYTYLLTPWSTDLLETPSRCQLVKKFRALYRTRHSLPHSQLLSPGPRLSLWMVRNRIRLYGELLLAPRPTPTLGTTPCRPSATAYSIHSQLPSILEAVPPSANWGRAMPWWQGQTLSWHIVYRKHKKETFRCQGSKTLSATDIWPTTP